MSTSPPEPVAQPTRARAAAGPARVAVVIPAKDEAARVAATVRSALQIPGVDVVIVVDDGSRDATCRIARDAGARTVRHWRNRGKGAAMTTGAWVAAAWDEASAPPHVLLFVDADLQDTAVATAALVPPVLAGEADMTIAVLPPQRAQGGGHGFVVRLARRGIERAASWTPTQPLSGMRCLSREAFEAAQPLAPGWGVEVGLTTDLLGQGFRVMEVPCELHHRVTGSNWRSQLHRARQYRDVAFTLLTRRLRCAYRAWRRAGRGG